MAGISVTALLRLTGTALVGSLMRSVDDRSRRNAWDAVCENRLRDSEPLSAELEAALRRGLRAASR